MCTDLQERKNTVSSANQLPESSCVKYYGEGGHPRVMFVGNSITRHGPKSDIGWNFDHGMAASSPEKDYVHLLMKETKKLFPEASFCVVQAAAWERDLLGCPLEEKFPSVYLFAPDTLIYRIGENVPLDGFDRDVMKRGIKRLLGYLASGNPKCKIVFTTNFWANPEKDAAIREYAAENGCEAPIELGDLGNDPKYRADGLFEHSGVAHHPGDLGMKTIAERVFPKLSEKLMAEFKQK